MKNTKKNKASKTAKRTKPVKKVKVITKPVIPTKKSVIEEIKPQEVTKELQFSETVIEKLPFDMVNDGFDFFSYCFQENGSFEDEDGNFYIDPRFTASWNSFLVMAGWTEAEYWKVVDSLPHEDCEQCKKEKEEQAEVKKDEASKNIN